MRLWKGAVKETREKGDTEKWTTETSFFQGENQCFLKKQIEHTKKKGLGPTAQNPHSRVALTPIPRRMCEKWETPKQKEGVKRTTSYWRKRCRTQSPEKGAKNLCTAAARPFFAKCETCHFQNEIGSAAPRVFFLSKKSNLVKNSNFKQKKIVRGAKIVPQKRSAKSRRSRTSKRSRRVAMTQNRSETLRFEAFRVFAPLRRRRHAPRRRRQKKTARKSLVNRGAQKSSKKAFVQRGPISQLRL